jgi:NDP-sugar pyrophosphorylase family protein
VYSAIHEEMRVSETRTLLNAGIYMLSASSPDEVAVGDTESLERDAFERLPPRSLAALAGRFDFIDMGAPESLQFAAHLLVKIGLNANIGNDPR